MLFTITLSLTPTGLVARVSNALCSSVSKWLRLSAYVIFLRIKIKNDYVSFPGFNARLTAVESLFILCYNNEAKG